MAVVYDSLYHTVARDFMRKQNADI